VNERQSIDVVALALVAIPVVFMLLSLRG